MAERAISLAAAGSGAVAAPHAATAQAGCDVLAAGGSATEAMVAMAASVAVTQSQANGLGGDGFWLIREPDGAIHAIDACGPAAAGVSLEHYLSAGHSYIPQRGADAAITVPGAIGGWQAALETVPAARRLPLAELLAPAIAQARMGQPLSGHQARCSAKSWEQLVDVPGFAAIYLPDGEPPEAGTHFVLPALSATLARLAEAGLDDWYRGDLAATHGTFLEGAGSPLRAADFAAFHARRVEPLQVTLKPGRVFNMPPPTQGVASLMILGLYERLGVGEAEGFAHMHGLIEAVKQAFLLRDAELGDPDFMAEPAQAWLSGDRLDALAAQIDMAKAMPWPQPPAGGDTIWMGAADAQGRAVSYIQSIYWEFGSGLTCPDTGVIFQNRGAGFSLKPGPNQLAPGKRPFHTLNPALAELADGRVMAYGTMGGEGQPQTQAQIFTRHVLYGQPLAEAIAAPRWLLGRTWGEATTTLKLERRFPQALFDELTAAGHVAEWFDEDFADRAGHSGAVVVHPDGRVEAAHDPRTDGGALAV